MPFEVDEATDYDELGMRITVLDIALTGVNEYMM